MIDTSSNVSPQSGPGGSLAPESPSAAGLPEALLQGILGVFESISAPNGAQDLLLVHMDAEGTVLYVSPSIQYLAGYKASEVIGQNWFELFGVIETSPYIYISTESRLVAKDAIITEGVLPARDGSERVLTWRIYQHPAGHDKEEGDVTMLGVDVTTQRARLAQAKEADRRLDERDRLLASLHALSRQLGRSLDLQRLYRLMYREIARRFLGSPHLVVALLSDDHTYFYCDFAIVDNEQVDHTTFPPLSIGEGPTSDCFRTGEPQIIDLLALRSNLPSGRVIQVGEDTQLPKSGLYVPLTAGDAVIGVMSVQRYETNAFDETDLNLLSVLGGMAGAAIQNALLYRKLQEQAEQMDTIMGTVRHGLVLLDRHGQVLLANPAGESYLALLGNITSDGETTHLGELPVTEILEKSSQDPATPYDAVLEGASPRTFEIQSAVIGAADASGGWVMVIRDVTDEREAQRYTQQQERLAAVGQLAAGIAHDFNNIMGAIVIYAQALQLQTSEPAGRKRLDTIVNQANHAAALIRQILDFSRRSVMEKMPLDLMPFIKELVQILRRTLPENIYVDFQHMESEYVIDADATRIQQALMNLAVNARDAMPGGGTLHIELGRITVTDSDQPVPGMKPGAWLELTVSDSGTGISADVLDHIFEPFFTTKAVGAGTGLGLAQVYGIMQQHNGEITVTSQIGQGTRFGLYFPLLDAPAQEPETRSPTGLGQQGSGGAVLVVEDEDAMREALDDILTMHGYTVYLAADGMEALGILDVHPDISLVLTDLVMPILGGEELSQAVHEQYPTMPVLFMTGHPRQSLEWAQQSQSYIHWLQKPFTADEVLDRVTELVA